jgi:DNA-binding GntR family transcriptional regulator
VYAAIRAEILAGRYAPGAKLSPRVIAAQHQVSLSVVREALTRLTEQDLVVAQPQLGFSVVALDIDDVRDISKLRILIEGTGLREAIEHADVEYEARVVASHHGCPEPGIGPARKVRRSPRTGPTRTSTTTVSC